MATYNRAHYIQQALNSLLSQTRIPDEIIVVDDGSTDNTFEIISTYYKDHVKYVYKENGGRSTALNVGIRLATSSHIWIFDDDDIALPNSLQVHTDYLNKNCNVDYTYSPHFDSCSEDEIWNKVFWEKAPWPIHESNELLIKTLENCFAMIPGMLIPKKCLLEVGLFDEKLLRSQDYDMTIKLARYYKAANIKVYTFIYRNHKGIRGAGTASHGDKEKKKIWRRYDKHIFLRVRKELKLYEYKLNLKPTLREQLTQNDYNECLLNRANIMFRHGLYEEACCDLKAVLSESSMKSDIADLILRATNIDDAIFVEDIDILANKLLEINDYSYYQYIKQINRGFYWTFIRYFRQKNWRVIPKIIYAFYLIQIYNIKNKYPFLK